MAKNPTPTNDPAALAFSAVEDALKDSVFSIETAAAPAPEKPPAEPAPRSERLRTADKIAAQAGSVANDDRLPPAAKALYDLRNRSSATPTWIAAILSAAWLLITGVAGYMRFGAQIGDFGGFVGSIEFIALLAIMVLPVLGIFAVATLFRRAQDLRNAAASITQAALRLAEPEITASDKVASVGQAVRREVNALGDGLERALSRAGELEVMIHNEVTALERTYLDNESRMRALIAELASQRESVLTNTERVREAITESHTGLVFDLDMISQRIAGTIIESGGNLTRALETAGNTLTTGFGDRTENFVSLVDNRTSDFLSAIDDSAGRLSLTFEDHSAAMSRSIENHTSELGNTLESRMSALTEALDGRVASISDTLEERTNALSAALDERTSLLSGAIDERTAALSNLLTDGGATLLSQLRDRGHEVSGALDQIGSRIAEDISGRSREAEVLLGALTRQLDESVSIQLNAMDSRLQSTLIEINGALDESSEKARITLSSAGADSLGQFDARLTEIASILDNRLHTLDGVIGDKGEKLIAALETHGTSFAARANVLEMALNQESGRFNDVVAERTREMGEVLGARTKAITETLGHRSREISDSLEGHASIIAEALDGRTQQLDTILGARAGEITTAIETRTRELDDTLTGRSRDLSEAIRIRSQELGDAITGGTQAFDQAISGRTQHLADTLMERTDTLAARFDERAQTLASTLEQGTEVLTTALDGRSQALGTAIEDHTRTLTSALDGGTQQLASTVGLRTQQLSDALGNRTQSLSETLTAHTAAMSETLGTRTAELAGTIEQQSNEARARLDAALRGATDTMTDRVTAMSDVIAGKVVEVNDNLGRGIDSAVARISDAEGGVVARIDAASATVGESARKAADIIETGVNSARKAIADMVDQRLGTLPEAITARADITAERLAALNASINTSITQSMADLEAGADRIEETIATRITVATRNIVTDVTATANGMDSAVRQALEQIRAAAGEIDQIVSVKAVGAVDTLGTRVADINRSVTEQTNAFAALVSEKSDQLQGALQNHGNVLRDALADNAREAEAIMSVSTSRILTDVTAALGKLNDSNLLLQRVLDASTANLANLESSVAQQTSAYSTTVRDAIGQTEQAGQMVTQHVGALQQTIRSMVDEFSGVLGRLDAEAVNMTRASDTLSTTSGMALETLEERRGAMDSLAASFAARADDIDGRMRMFAQSIADTVNDTERRLIGARRAMDEALNATTHTVTDALTTTTAVVNEALAGTQANVAEVLSSTTTAVNDALYSTTERFSSQLNSSTTQMDNAMRRAGDMAANALHQTTGEVNAALQDNATRVNAALTETGDRVGDVLAATAGNVTDVLNSTTGTLAETISESTSSVRNTVASHTGSLRQAFDQTTGSFRQALDKTTDEVTARLADFRDTADGEGQRANAALQKAQQQMVAEMQRAIEDATQRFNDTARAMRETAREVGSELEATRSELARGVSELPEETRASAAAMRRVVAEQIEALSELNAIVRAQPATHDLNDRRPQRPAAPPRIEAPYQAPQRPENYRPEPPRQPEPERQPEPVRTPQPVRQDAWRPEPRPAAPVPQRAAEVVAVADADPAAPREEGGGWLRDVLRNATAKQASAQPQAGLSGLTDEIARAIDDDALADAWTRYQSGESDVFSRRIYTLTGQGTYDEVRKKLQREPDFARTAAAYMSEFEQLLKRAAGGANPAAETREYLLSDRGKVYTTLAHASGRLN